MYNSDFAVQQKLTQPCKSTILQLKKKSSCNYEKNKRIGAKRRPAIAGYQGKRGKQG